MNCPEMRKLHYFTSFLIINPAKKNMGPFKFDSFSESQQLLIVYQFTFDGFLSRPYISLKSTTTDTVTSPCSQSQQLMFTLQMHFSSLVSSKVCSEPRCVSISFCSISSNDSLSRCSDIHSSAPTMEAADFFKSSLSQ